MSLELGVILAIGIVTFAFVSLLMTRRQATVPVSTVSKLEQAGAFVVLALGGATIATLVVDRVFGWELLRWTGYIAVGYGVLGNVVGVRALSRHFRRSPNA